MSIQVQVQFTDPKIKTRHYNQATVQIEGRPRRNQGLAYLGSPMYNVSSKLCAHTPRDEHTQENFELT